MTCIFEPIIHQQRSTEIYTYNNHSRLYNIRQQNSIITYVGAVAGAPKADGAAAGAPKPPNPVAAGAGAGAPKPPNPVAAGAGAVQG